MFSHGITLSKKAYRAGLKLDKIRREMVEADPTIFTGYYYDKLEALKSSKIFDCLNFMPKPAVHHIHLTAGADLHFMVEKLLYYDYVYYNQKENTFRVTKKGCTEEGFIKVNELRMHYESSTAFDEHIYNEMVL